MLLKLKTSKNSFMGFSTILLRLEVCVSSNVFSNMMCLEWDSVSIESRSSYRKQSLFLYLLHTELRSQADKFLGIGGFRQANYRNTSPLLSADRIALTPNV